MNSNDLYDDLSNVFGVNDLINWKNELYEKKSIEDAYDYEDYKIGNSSVTTWEALARESGDENFYQNDGYYERSHLINSIPHIVTAAYSKPIPLASSATGMGAKLWSFLVSKMYNCTHTEPKELIKLQEIFGQMKDGSYIDTIVMISQKTMCEYCSALILGFLKISENNYVIGNSNKFRGNFWVISQDILNKFKSELKIEIEEKEISKTRENIHQMDEENSSEDQLLKRMKKSLEYIDTILKKIGDPKESGNKLILLMHRSESSSRKER